MYFNRYSLFSNENKGFENEILISGAPNSLQTHFVIDTLIKN